MLSIPAPASSDLQTSSSIWVAAPPQLIASLGGPKTAKPVTVMKVTVNVTAPNQPNLQLLPTGTVSFDGIDTSNLTSTITIKVH